MTNAELEAIYKSNIGKSRMTALQAIYTQGWYAGAGVTVPTAGNALNKAQSATAPTTIVSVPHVKD